ncbi:hypothetical protein D9M71_738530 [compost metagenome]
MVIADWRSAAMPRMYLRVSLTMRSDRGSTSCRQSTSASSMLWLRMTRSEPSFLLAHNSARYLGYTSAKRARTCCSAFMALTMKWLTSSTSVCTSESAAARLSSVMLGLGKYSLAIRLRIASWPTTGAF